MPYGALADLVLVLHLGFVLFAILGGLLVLRWRRMAWLHLPALFWGAIVEFSGWICPLTPLENNLRSRAGETSYSGDFISHYIEPVLYSDTLTRQDQILYGLALLAINVGVYAAVFQRHRLKGMAPTGYQIVPARVEHLEKLPAIERAAASLFAGHDVSESVLADETSLDDFRNAQSEGLLWVALSNKGDPVGFAFVELVGGIPHLDELDVLPAHARRGVGAALVRHVCAWARENDQPAVTLTTFRDIPWNAPFYEKLGFSVLERRQWTPALSELVQKEAQAGLDPSRRVVMRGEV